MTHKCPNPSRLLRSEVHPYVGRRWFAHGQRITLRDAPTHYGPMSIDVISHVGEGRIAATLRPPRRDRRARIKLRLRHPDGHPIQSVSVNGEPWQEVDRARELIVLPCAGEAYRIMARFAASTGD